jgi:hypothetical protein
MLGPELFRVCGQGQVAGVVKDQFLVFEAIRPQQEVTLVEPVLAKRRRRGPVFQGRAANRLEGAEVGPLEPELVVEAGSGEQDLAVRLVGAADHELGRLPGARGALSHHELASPAHALQDVLLEPLGGAQPREPFGVGCLEVHRYPVRQLGGSLDGGPLGARQDLQMHVPRKAILAAHDLHGGDHPLHRLASGAADGRTQEQASCQSPPQQFVKGGRQLLWRKGDPPYVTARAVRAVVAVALAGIGQ